MLSPLAFVVLALALVLGSLHGSLDSNSTFATQKVNQEAKVSQKILLVTAHPDDETMFFAPTVLALAGKAARGELDFGVVCLSNGNAEGLGETRTKEFERALDVLGVRSNRRWLVNHPELQDNMTAEWDSAVVASVLLPYVLDLKIDTILTFDLYGVSSHPNHISIPSSIPTLLSLLPPKNTPLRTFTLVSSSIPYKYLSLLTVPLSKLDLYGYRLMQKLEDLVLLFLAVFDPELLKPRYPRHPDAHAMPEFVNGWEKYVQAVGAMRAHESQLVWFRWGWVGFAKYMWVNTWVELRV